DREYRQPRRVNVKQPAALDNQPDLVLVVPVLAAELRQHGLEARCVRVDVDDVSGNIAAAGLQLVDLRRAGRQDLVGRRSRLENALGQPSLVLDAALEQVGTDRLWITKRPVLVRNAHGRHVPSPRAAVRTRPLGRGRSPRTGTPESRCGAPPRRARRPRYTVRDAARERRAPEGAATAYRGRRPRGAPCPDRCREW